ncbi:AsmA family protein [Pseudomonas sp. GD03944]|uniref:AsmA family protein n=1 Tax=Pseudomonas sp. GD03944 TaxID=2975409 RepID=UPI00244B5637|nr:AsmA family protein [Pseudomonas sp. GD03944]MDH1262315.1 AsmA family protein [Pseudomonas sp. GD03944]
MTRVRRVVGICLALVLVPVAALMLFVVLFDWNLLRPTINTQVSEALHRPFAINGDLRLVWRREEGENGWHAWVPWPHLSAEQLVLGNPEWAEGETFVSLDRVALRLAPLPLLWKTVQIPYIELGAPKANLQRLADGRANWTFDLGDENTDDAPSPWTLDIGSIAFDEGQITLNDQSLNSAFEVQVTQLGAPLAFSDVVGKQRAERVPASEALAYAFAWTAKGRYKGQPLNGNGKLGGLLALHDAEVPFPLQADIRAGATRIVLAGTLTDPKNLGELDLQLSLSGSSLGHLYGLTGVILPETPAYATDGRLIARLHDEGGARFRYQGFSGRIGDSDIQGDLEFVAGEPRPKLSGTLVSNQLRFADLAPLIGADSNAEKKERGASSRQPADRVLPVEEFQTDRWQAMDADVRFTGKRIVHSEALPISDLSTRLLLDAGVLSLDPLRFGVAGGTLDSLIHLDGSRTPLQGRARLNARGFKLKQLFPTFEPMQTSLGELNGDADLRGQGNSVAALLGTANGDLKMVINDGAVSRGLMEIAGLNVGNYLVNRLFGDEEVQINCALADLGFKNGLMTTRLAVVDTENAIIRVDGTADFAKERLDMDITPASKGLRIFSLRSPLYVQGSFKNPSAGVQVTPLALRGAGMVLLGVTLAPAAGVLALVAPSGDQPDQCGPLLKQLQGNR